MAEHLPGTGEVEPRGLGADGDGETGNQQLTGEAGKLLAPLAPTEPLRPPRTEDSCLTVMLKLSGSIIKKNPEALGEFSI